MEDRSLTPQDADSAHESKSASSEWIEASSTFSEDDLAVGYLAYMKHYQWRYNLLYVAAIAVLLLTAWLAWRFGWSPMLLALIACAGSLASLRFLLASYFRRSLEGNPNLGQIVHWRLDPQGFEITLPDAGDARPWGALYRVIEAPRGFLLMPQRQRFYWLPNHAFRDPRDQQLLRQWLQEYLK